MDRKIAFFVDGGFFVQRIKYYHRKYFDSVQLEPKHIVYVLQRFVRLHKDNLNRDDIYRVYYYDAPPFDKQVRFWKLSEEYGFLKRHSPTPYNNPSNT